MLEPLQVVMLCVVVGLIVEALWVSSKVISDKWFSNICGMQESLFRCHCGEAFEEIEKELWIKNVKSGDKVRAGLFMQLTLGDLKQSFSNPVVPSRLVQLKIISRSDLISENFVNVAYLQAKRTSRGCLFQVASNFNAIETIGDSADIEHSSFVTDYIHDRTQGPSACVSAGAGAISRVYAAFYDKNTPPSSWRQTNTKQINTLENLSSYFPVKNGYVVLPPDSNPLPHDGSTDYMKLMWSYKVGYQQNVQVTTGAAKNHWKWCFFDVVPKKQNQIVDQVFGAALNMAQGYTGRMNSRRTDAEEKAKFLLEAAYTGAYLSAINFKKRKLFLTPVGGGVFRNRLDWIYDALLNAHSTYALSSNSTLEKVYLVLYSPGDVWEPLRDIMRQRQIPFKWVTYNNRQKKVVEDYKGDINE